MINLILPDWREPLPPFAEAHIDDLEDRIADLCKRLEWSRRRAARARQLRNQVRGLQAENERLRGVIRRLEATAPEGRS